MDRYALPDKLPFSSKKLRAKVIISYIFDYVTLLVLIAAFYLLDKIEPFHQPFSLKNYTLMYPYADPERVPIPLAMAIVCLGPAVVIAIYTMVIDGLFATGGGSYKKYTFKSRLWELNCGILGLLLGVGSSFVITAALKNAIGKPRPDIIARCNMPQDIAAGFLRVENFTLATFDLCDQPDHAKLKDGFRSFPSGHSSSAWAGLFYLSLYLMGKLHVLDSRGEVWKTFVVLIPSLGAALIAGSRIMDARHHPFDVITGSLLGIATAWAAYRQYFPPLSDFRAKGRAYPIRTWGRVGEEFGSQGSMDRLPLKADAGSMGYGNGRDVSPEGSESGASRRRRGPGDAADTTQVMPPPPNYAAPYSTENPYGGAAGSRRPGGRRDEWDDSSDEDRATDLELQPTQRRYDPPASHLTQDTSYTSYKPQAQTSQETRRSAEGGGGGDIGVAHGHPRGVQLTESYASKPSIPL